MEHFNSYMINLCFEERNSENGILRVVGIGRIGGISKSGHSATSVSGEINHKNK